MTNSAKTPLFSSEQRVAMVEAAVDGSPGRVRVEAVAGGLLAEYCARVGAAAVVKGVRTAADVEHETPMALMNRHLTGVDTVLLPADPRWAHLSSSLVKEVATLGGDVRGLLPEAALTALTERLGERSGEHLGGRGAGGTGMDR